MATKALLKKYLDKTCSPEEEQEVVRFLKTTEGSQLLEEVADEYWEQPNDEKLMLPSDMIYQKIESKLEFIDSTKKPDHQKIRYTAYAAVIVLFVVSVLFLMRGQWATQTTEDQHAQVELITKSTTRGQKSIILLSDGSKVTLNSESSITYPKYFTDSIRAITLTGEAFFEVAKDKQRPFEVLAAGVTTRALGTSFNIKNRNASCKISLTTGRVVVSKKQPGRGRYFLEPGEALQYTASDADPIKSSFNYEEDVLWKDGILYFKNTPFNEIIRRLELWYDVSIDIQKSSLSARTYTGRFDNESLEHVLESMSFALDFNYILNDKNVKIN